MTAWEWLILVVCGTVSLWAAVLFLWFLATVLRGIADIIRDW